MRTSLSDRASIWARLLMAGVVCVSSIQSIPFADDHSSISSPSAQSRFLKGTIAVTDAPGTAADNECLDQTSPAVEDHTSSPPPPITHSWPFKYSAPSSERGENWALLVTRVHLRPSVLDQTSRWAL